MVMLRAIAAVGASLAVLASAESGRAKALGGKLFDEAAIKMLKGTASAPWNGRNETTVGFSLDRLAFDTSDGASRVAYLYIPESAKGKGPVPLLVDFHALASDPFAEAELTQFPKKADEEGFVVVYPEGKADATFPLGLVGYSWNAGGCCPNACADKINDALFARELVDVVAKHAAIDRKRVYATGMSNGGFMTNRVACQVNDVFAAFAPVSGLFTNTSHAWGYDAFACETSEPLPVLHFHGTTDPIVPYDGNWLLGFPHVETYIQGWLERNGVQDDEPKATYGHGQVSCKSWGSGRTNVTLCTVDGGGHSWPGSTGPFCCPSSGTFACTKDISATDQIWNFLKQYTLP